MGEAKETDLNVSFVVWSRARAASRPDGPPRRRSSQSTATTTTTSHYLDSSSRYSGKIFMAGRVRAAGQWPAKSLASASLSAACDLAA